MERCSFGSYYEKFIATREVKCIDEEIPFEIPKGWEWCRLNDLALYRKGPFGSSLTSIGRSLMNVLSVLTIRFHLKYHLHGVGLDTTNCLKYQVDLNHPNLSLLIILNPDI